jgi:ADP-heptose:LPS heptosyltransferase
MLGVALVEKDLIVSLTRAEELEAMSLVKQFEAPVAIHIGSSFTPNKSWKAEAWKELVRRNTDYDFIQVGASSDEAVDGALDLRNIPFRVALAVVKHVKGFVGVDSIFAHVTSVFGTRGVVLFGPSSPVIWGHPNNINLSLGLRCAPCVDVLGDDPCPYGNACMRDLSAAAVELALRQQMDKNSPAAASDTPPTRPC